MEPLPQPMLVSATVSIWRLASRGTHEPTIGQMPGPWMCPKPGSADSGGAAAVSAVREC